MRHACPPLAELKLVWMQIHEGSTPSLATTLDFYQLMWFNIIMKLFWNILKTIGTFLVLFGLFFYFFNFRALNINIKYWSNKTFSKESQKQIEAYLPTVKSVKKTKPIWPEGHIVIPKLSLNIPVIWNVPIEKTLDELANGVVHTKGSALPPQKGNVFISGHSSYFWNGPYSSIFSVIVNLENDDEIAIVYRDYTYIYKVYNKITVKPDQVEYLNQDRSKHMLSLMTCTPIGTDWNRLIVQAYLTN